MPFPFLSGEILYAADLNPRGCSLRRAANQTLNDVSLTVVSWDTQDVDTDAMWSSGTTITIPFDGIWAITAQVSINAAIAASAARGFIDITVNTTDIYRQIITSGEQFNAHGIVIPLVESDTFTVSQYADTAAGTTMTAKLNCYLVR